MTADSLCALPQSPAAIVTLNVGGATFATTVATLTRVGSEEGGAAARRAPRRRTAVPEPCRPRAPRG
jgi:hypothetical protein